MGPKCSKKWSPSVCQTEDHDKFANVEEILAGRDFGRNSGRNAYVHFLD